MQDLSLNQIMNDMAARTDVLNATRAASGEALDEMGAFTRLDPVMANLNKQYLDAKNYRKELQTLNGLDDAMCEVAIDMEDSAWCALQTRYIELRQERELMAKAQRMMRQAEQDALEEAEREERKTALEFLMQFKAIKALRAKEREFNIDFFVAAYVLLLFNVIPSVPRRDLENNRPLAA